MVCGDPKELSTGIVSWLFESASSRGLVENMGVICKVIQPFGVRAPFPATLVATPHKASKRCSSRHRRDVTEVNPSELLARSALVGARFPACGFEQVQHCGPCFTVKAFPPTGYGTRLVPQHCQSQIACIYLAECWSLGKYEPSILPMFPLWRDANQGFYLLLC